MLTQSIQVHQAIDKHTLVTTWQVALFLTIVAAACAVSGYALFTQSIRLDESQSLWVSTKPVATILRFVAEDVHVPLYHLLLHFWVQLFGNTIVVARSLSFLLYLATLPALYILAKETSTKQVALLAVLLFAISPFVLWFSSEARMYTLFTFVTCINHIYFLRLTRTRGKSAKIGFLVSTFIGMMSHYFFIFLALTQVGFILLRALTTHNSRRPQQMLNQLNLPAIVLGLQLIAAVIFLPWLAYVGTLGFAANTQPMIPRPTSYNIFQTLVNLLFGFPSQGIQSLVIALWPLLVIVLFFIFTQRRQLRVRDIDYFLLATFLPIILVFFVSFFRPIFLSRYLILVAPSLFFLIAWLLLSHAQRVTRFVMVGLIGTMFGLLVYQNVSAATPVKEEYEAVADYLSLSATPQDIIAITVPFTIYPIEYGYTGHARLDTIPPWNRYISGSIPEFNARVLRSQIIRYKQQYANMYVVYSYDQGYEAKVKQYLDTNYAIIDRKKFLENIEVRVYQLRYD